MGRWGIGVSGAFALGTEHGFVVRHGAGRGGDFRSSATFGTRPGGLDWEKKNLSVS
jgi:hypothetical protein